MLPARNRLRTSVDFSHTVRSGVRQGRRNVVLYAALSDDDGAPSRFGFIVSKAVGNAVTRNLVKRRLREAGAETLRERPTGVDIVVRALPAAASADWSSLRSDYVSALRGAVRKLATGSRQEEVNGSGE
ncbi:ribonuclease P protein component [Sinomonas sp. JGH33]|uniref:Ribonuclease P protein component n=1 Tax=Sinomonas terricola TaxID=3110330 RepID=A0ABU5T794_9MICC|nr:ribonuclease P protein component [Sinomonas sp. JGH33]MEA5455550.1 ribonuclease P protein component [Sinomonas sp. JGH33]